MPHAKGVIYSHVSSQFLLCKDNTESEMNDILTNVSYSNDIEFVIYFIYIILYLFITILIFF